MLYSNKHITIKARLASYQVSINMKKCYFFIHLHFSKIHPNDAVCTKEFCRGFILKVMTTIVSLYFQNYLCKTKHS